MRSGLVGVSRYVEGKYHIKTVARDGLGQTPDDYHSIVTRISDDAQISLISQWKWVMKLMTRRKTLDRYFKQQDKRNKKLKEEKEMIIGE